MTNDLYYQEQTLIWRNFKRNGYISPYIEVKDAGHKGLGVFAKTDIMIDTIIEYCHSVILSSFTKDLKDEKLRQYIYSFDSPNFADTKAILPLGFGMIYNSADNENEANAKYFAIEAENLLFYKTTKNILKNQEILLWWGQPYYDWWIKGMCGNNK